MSACSPVLEMNDNNVDLGEDESSDYDSDDSKANGNDNNLDDDDHDEVQQNCWLVKCDHTSIGNREVIP